MVSVVIYYSWYVLYALVIICYRVRRSGDPLGTRRCCDVVDSTSQQRRVPSGVGPICAIAVYGKWLV